MTKAAPHIVLGGAGRVIAFKILRRHPQRLQAVFPAMHAEIERGELAQSLHFQSVAAPAKAQPLQDIDRLGWRDGASIQRRAGLIEDRLRRQWLNTAIFHGGELRGGIFVAVFPPR